VVLCFFFSSRRRHTRSKRDWSSDVCSSDLRRHGLGEFVLELVEGRELSVEVGASLLHPLRGGFESGNCLVRNGAQAPGAPVAARSEERRVGKEGRSRWAREAATRSRAQRGA